MKQRRRYGFVYRHEHNGIVCIPKCNLKERRSPKWKQRKPKITLMLWIRFYNPYFQLLTFLSLPLSLSLCVCICSIVQLTKLNYKRATVFYSLLSHCYLAFSPYTHIWQGLLDNQLRNSCALLTRHEQLFDIFTCFISLTHKNKLTFATKHRFTYTHTHTLAATKLAKTDWLCHAAIVHVRVMHIVSSIQFKCSSYNSYSFVCLFVCIFSLYSFSIALFVPDFSICGERKMIQ